VEGRVKKSSESEYSEAGEFRGRGDGFRGRGGVIRGRGVEGYRG
jgi:hypothetical protein